jgi:hypothetical protein
MPGVDTLAVTAPELAIAIGFGEEADPSLAHENAASK